MRKNTITQSFNADERTRELLNKARNYGIPKDTFIREAVSAHYSRTIEPHEANLKKKKLNGDLPF